MTQNMNHYFWVIDQDRIYVCQLLMTPPSPFEILQRVQLVYGFIKPLGGAICGAVIILKNVTRHFTVQTLIDEINNFRDLPVYISFDGLYNVTIAQWDQETYVYNRNIRFGSIKADYI